MPLLARVERIPHLTNSSMMGVDLPRHGSPSPVAAWSSTRSQWRCRRQNCYFDQTATVVALVVAIFWIAHLFSPLGTTVKQLSFPWLQAVQKPVALSFHVPALPLPDCSSGSRVIFPSGVKIILNFAPDSDRAVNGCPVKKVAFISFGAMGSALKAALAPKSSTAIARPARSTQKSPFLSPIWIQANSVAPRL